MTEQTLPNPTLAYFSPGVAGYGHRLFLPSNLVYWDGNHDEEMECNLAAHNVLIELSMWKGHDKRWTVNDHEYFGYEFPIARWNDICKTLAEHDITFRVFDIKRDTIEAG